MDKNFAEQGVRQWRKTYSSTEVPNLIFQRAVLEMPDAIHDAKVSSWLLSDDGQFYVLIDPIQAFHGEADLYPRGTVSVIHVEYADPSTLDRVRVWLYSLGRPKFHP